MPGVYLNHIQTDKFKIASLSISLLTQLTRDTASLNALIPAVLCRGSTHYDNMEKLSSRLDELYGSSVYPFVRRVGEIQMIGLSAAYPESVFLPEGENVTKDVIDLLCEMLVSPATRGGLLLPAYVDSEKEKLAEVIRSRVNNKTSYSLARCGEEMCCFEDYSAGRLGRAEDCESIYYRKLTRQYRDLLQTSPVEIFYCGRDSRRTIEKRLKDALCTMPRGDLNYDIGTDIRMNAVEDTPRVCVEEMAVKQAKLVIGFRLGNAMQDPDIPALAVFNAVYGAGVTSKLFVNVREKMQLCYSASSTLNTHKGLLFALAGIDAERFEETKAEILHQLDEIRSGNVTDDELSYAKAGILSDLSGMLDSTGALESFTMGNILSGLDLSTEEYADLIGRVTKEDIISIAQSVECDMIYFLKGNSSAEDPEEESEEETEEESEENA